MKYQPTSFPAKASLPTPSGSRSEWNNTKSAPTVKNPCVDCAGACGNRYIRGWANDGYVLEKRSLPSAYEFDAMYKLFDEHFGVDADPDLLALIQAEADLWMTVPGNARTYSSAPVGFRDRRVRDDKAEKAYFQYTREFGSFVDGICASSRYLAPGVDQLFAQLDNLAGHADRVFRHALTSIGPAGGPVVQHLLSLSKLPVLVKMLAYYPHHTDATARHFDKSLLSLVMNASDMKRDRFRIGTYGDEKSDMVTPDRFVEDPAAPGTAVLFPGAIWRKIGVRDILPSPHWVKPVASGMTRFSVVAFLLMPGLDVSDVTTTH